MELFRWSPVDRDVRFMERPREAVLTLELEGGAILAIAYRLVDAPNDLAVLVDPAPAVATQSTYERLLRFPA